MAICAYNNLYKLRKGAGIANAKTSARQSRQTRVNFPAIPSQVNFTLLLIGQFGIFYMGDIHDKVKISAKRTRVYADQNADADGHRPK